MSEDRPLRILHVVQGYAPAVGGTERVIQRLSEELVSQFGDEVTVFTSDCYSAEAFPRPAHPRLRPGREVRSGVTVRRFHVVRSLGPLLQPVQDASFRLGLPLNQYVRTWYAGPVISGLTRAVQRHPADVVVASSFPLRHMYQALRGARRAGRPCVLVGGIHPEDRWGYDRSMIHRAIRQADLYVAYTGFEAGHVIAKGADLERVEVIGLGVDPEPFAAVDAEAAKRALGFGDHPVIGFIGQLGVHKGVDTLLEAMPAIWERRPETRLLIAGAHTEFVKQIEERVAQYDPEARQKVVLHYDFDEQEKPRLFGAVDAFVYPSGYESFGVAFLEAWSAGKPVIGCRSGAVPDVVRDGQDGVLVPFRDAEALAASALSLLDNPEWARGMGLIGRERVRSRHTWPAVARRFRESYVRTIARRATAQ